MALIKAPTTKPTAIAPNAPLGEWNTAKYIISSGNTKYTKAADAMAVRIMEPNYPCSMPSAHYQY
jgi:hypothetical protein